jgi:hypothetical protein
MPDERRWERITLIARLDAVFAATIPDRVARAFRTLDTDTLNSPLRASQGSGTTGGGIGDPTGDQALNGGDRYHITDDAVRAARSDIIRIVMAREALSKDLARHLNQWAPTKPAKQNSADNETAGLCQSHLRYKELGHVSAATRYGKGRTNGKDGNCGFCRTILTEWGRLPNYELLRRYDAGDKLTEQTIARILGLAGKPPLAQQPVPLHQAGPGDLVALHGPNAEEPITYHAFGFRPVPLSLNEQAPFPPIDPASPELPPPDPTHPASTNPPPPNQPAPPQPHPHLVCTGCGADDLGHCLCRAG